MIQRGEGAQFRVEFDQGWSVTKGRVRPAPSPPATAYVGASGGERDLKERVGKLTSWSLCGSLLS